MSHGTPENGVERRITGVSHGTPEIWRRWRSNMSQLGLRMVLQRHGGVSARTPQRFRFSWYSRGMEVVRS